jgi:hypothetical protein
MIDATPWGFPLFSAGGSAARCGVPYTSFDAGDDR